MRIYVVQGSTGQYDDHCEWLVKAFKSKDKAKEFVAQANEHAENLKSNRESEYSFSDEAHPMDPNYITDYTGSSYTFHPVELED